MRIQIAYGVALFIVSITLVFAHGGSESSSKPKRITSNENHSQVESTTDHKEINGKLIEETIVDGFKLRIKVVDVKDSVPDGGNHNLLVNIKRAGRTQYKLSVTATVDDMKGEKKSKSMMELGDWYLAGYDFGSEGEYSITVSFQSTDERIHSSTINYP